jgi:hypothetical protein
MSDTGNETYHRGTANGNSRIGVLFKNFYFGLIKHVAEGKMSNPKRGLEVNAGALSMVQDGLDKCFCIMHHWLSRTTHWS